MNAGAMLYMWLRHWEGRDGQPALQAYRDGGGVPTIAYGRTAGVKMGDCCTLKEAESWLADEVTSVASSLNRILLVQLRQHEFDAIVAFVYNIGIHAFMHGGPNDGPSQVMLALNAGQFRRAMDLHAAWCHDNGVVVPGLVRRRAAEREMFDNANYFVYP